MFYYFKGVRGIRGSIWIEEYVYWLFYGDRLWVKGYYFKLDVVENRGERKEKFINL